MTPQQHEREKELFHRLKNLSPEQRKTALASACPADSELRAKVERVLAQHDQEKPTAEFRPKVDAAPQTPIADDSQIGKYRILRPLGAGAMGTVYAAEQDQPKRTVALKVIKVSSDPERMRLYFDREIELLGQLTHPGIAQIYDAGIVDTHSGPQPFFAMELIEGRSLTGHADKERLGTRRRLELMAKVCDAVEHAHQKGIIHRDLKPGNILVDESGQPKILDFGLARATDSDMRAATASSEYQVAGTIGYMSPEQLRGRLCEIDTRSDVYALGVVTYELLTGELPYDVRGKSPPEALGIVTETDPTQLSSINRALRGDIETIVAKAIEKDQDQRYASAAAFAADLNRLLHHQPIEARPPSLTYQVRKFVRRRPAVAVSVLVFVVAAVVSVAFGMSEARQRRIAEGAQKQAEDNLELAQKREKEATEARDQTQIVADFQSSMLGQTDAEAMGLAIVDGFEDRIRAALAQRTEDQGELDRVMHEWRQRTLKAGPTTVALAVLDEFVLGKSAETIEKDFADQPLVRAALQQTVADTYQEIGLYPPAMPLQEAALATRRRELGDDHPDTLTSISAMGHLLQSMGKYEEALAYHREALEGFRRVLGNDHPDTLVSINNVGGLLNAQAKYAEAEPYYREALEGSRRVEGDDHPSTLTSINNMGMLLQSMGKLEEALPYFREALEGRRRVLGDDHPGTLTSINNMGGLLDAQAKYAEAEPYYREALAGSRSVLGDDHPNTLGSINNMGLLLESMGKYHEAEPYYREALEGYRRVLGDDHPDALASIGNMGTLLQSMGKLAEAGPYYREVLERTRRVLGDDHPHTLTSINNMGYLLQSMGKIKEAEPYYLEALEGSRRVLGDDHPRTLNSINNMGALLKSMGKLAEAEPHFREALEGFRRVLGDDHPNTLISIDNVGGLLASMDKLAEAEPYRRKALEGFRRVLGDEHGSTLGSIHNMGRLLRDLGRLEEAEALGAEAVEGARRSLPEGHWYTGLFLSSYGTTLSKLERYSDAETALLEAHGILEGASGPQHKRTIGVIKSLADLYDAWHADEPDAGHDAEAAAWRAKLPAAERAASLIKLGIRLLENDRHAEAEAVLRECLEIRQKALAEGHWLIFNTMSVLGEALAGQAKFAEAEARLVEGYEKMTPPPHLANRKQQTLERIIKLYEAWDAAEPNQGYDAKAAEWHAKLEEEGAKAARHEGRQGKEPASQPAASAPNAKD